MVMTPSLKRVIGSLIEAAKKQGRLEAYEHAMRYCQSDSVGYERTAPEWKRAAAYFQYQVDHIRLGPAWERGKETL